MEAACYEIDPSGQARCRLCHHHCRIASGHRGRCQTRYYDGKCLQALNYGQCTAIALDPIEKKPLYPWARGAAISPAPSVRTGRFPNRKRPSVN